MTLEEKVRAHVEGIYYSDVETKEPWEPFEGHFPEDIEGYIDNDTEYWLKFIEENCNATT